MSSVVIDIVNHIGIIEGHPYLLTFDDSKGNHVEYDDTNITGVD